MRKLASLPINWLFFPLIFLLGGCSIIPWLQQPSSDFQQWRPSEIRAKYKHDQQQRRQLAGEWQLQAILDVEHPEHGRRNRLTISSQHKEQLRLRIYGPFKQIAVDLIADSKWLNLIKPNERKVVRVPATAAGMAYLTGYAINPLELLQFFLGQAAPLATPPTQSKNGLTAQTQQQEQLTIDPNRGYILQRYSPAQAIPPYSASYLWPEQQNGANNSPSLPKELSITLPDDSMVLTFIMRKWQFFPSGGKLSRFSLPKGFTLVEPFGKF